ncbi:hypothetical protein Tco_1519708 [Tanacetum coccineum]
MNTGTELSVQKPENAIKSLTSQEAPIDQFPKENDTRGLKKAQKEWGFYTKTLIKEAQRPLTHGLPHIEHQMIEGMKRDKIQERLEDLEASLAGYK